MSTETITDVATLEAIVGKVPGPLDMKVMDHLDDSALRWLALSPLLFVSFGTQSRIGITLGSGAPGFIGAPDPKRLRVPLAALDDAALARPGDGFGTLMLLPGVPETLRVNGRVTVIDNGAIELAVDECYLHCAKALIRSEFWAAMPSTEAPDSPTGFLADTRFMALATIDANGRADVSPKGDPAGAMLREHDRALWYADRPGNRRVDSFRNILTQPRIAALALIPGSTRVAALGGSATITTGETMRNAFAVRERVPKIVTRVDQPTLELRDSAALARLAPWPLRAAAADIDAAAMFAAHVQQSTAKGMQAKLARAALKIPGVMKKGLDHDYKNNLY
jgi:predicted pyridoxine 5'-phosphate oxidase superfamily flavin-nucleotide-binding protein